MKGKLYYFGAWADTDGALQKWIDDRDFLLAEQAAPEKGITVRDLCNLYLLNQQRRLRDDEIGESSYGDYLTVCTRLVKHFNRESVFKLTSPS